MQHNEDSGVLEAFAQYTQAFQVLDARAVAQHFHEPAFFITPKEVVCLPTIEALEHTYARVMADMPPDYVRTAFSPLSVHRFSDDLTMVSKNGTWKNAGEPGHFGADSSRIARSEVTEGSWICSEKRRWSRG